MGFLGFTLLLLPILWPLLILYLPGLTLSGFLTPQEALAVPFLILLMPLIIVAMPISSIIDNMPYIIQHLSEIFPFLP